MVGLQDNPCRRAAKVESYSAAPYVSRLSVGDRSVLHDGRRQVLFELNETADVIWRGLSSCAGEAEAVSQLVARGLTPADAEAYVGEAARAWMTAGHLAPRSALRMLASPPDELRRLVIHELSVEIAFHGAPASPCDLVASAFYVDGPQRDRLSIVAHGEVFLFFLNGDIRCACPADSVAAQLKATLTELYLGAVDGAFLAHGALLFHEGFCVFLSGGPGAGKTTLALALAAAGWSYGGDDIVRVLPDGQACPIAFAAGVKSGAWPLLAGAWPQIGRLPIWMRSDGQTVRYVQPPGALGGRPQALDAVVVLAREAGAPARMQPIATVEALQALLESACSERWALTGGALAALTARLERARCRRLVYSDLDGAVAALEALCRGEA